MNTRAPRVAPNEPLDGVRRMRLFTDIELVSIELNFDEENIIEPQPP
jgi:hypothetical protein